jgi:hypothetical protein
MKGFVLAVGVGLAALGLTNAASAQELGAPTPVVYQSAVTVYSPGCCPQPVTTCCTPVRVYYAPTCTPTCWSPTVRYVSYRPHSCCFTGWTCHPRVIHHSGWCR